MHFSIAFSVCLTGDESDEMGRDEIFSGNDSGKKITNFFLI